MTESAMETANPKVTIYVDGTVNTTIPYDAGFASPD